MDSDDLRKSWFVGKILSSRTVHGHDEEQEPLDPEASGDDTAVRPTWGAGGISVSADDTLLNHDRRSPQ